jgi:hypothetical protein
MFRVAVTADTLQPNTLNAAIIQAGPKPKQISTCELSLQLVAYGLYNTLRLSVASQLDQLAEQLLGLISYSVRSSYEWLAELVDQRFAQLPSVVATKIYEPVRAALGPELARYVWLYLFVNGEAFYLTDARARDVLLEEVHATSGLLGQSALSLAAEFVANIQPFDHTFAPALLERRSPMEVALSKAPYTAYDLASSESAAYGAPVAVAHLVASINDMVLVAGYRRDAASAIRPCLMRASAAVRARMISNTTALHEALALVKSVKPAATYPGQIPWSEMLTLNAKVAPFASVDLKKMYTRISSDLKHRKLRTA